MPVNYNISPGLKMVIYYCSGVITISEIFKALESAVFDKRRISGLITMIDYSDAVENVQWGEWKELISRTESLIDRGILTVLLVLISHSTAMRLLVDVINMLPRKVPFRMQVVSTVADAISLLGLSESKEEVIQLWNESKSLSA
jgi:hypothetical protein